MDWELVLAADHDLALNCEDLNDHDMLRHDPPLTAVLDKPGGALAGKSTLNRLEHACRIDLDATGDSLYGDQEGRRFHATATAIAICRYTFSAASTCGTIRLKLLKIGARVRFSVRRIKITMASAYPGSPIIRRRGVSGSTNEPCRQHRNSPEIDPRQGPTVCTHFHSFSLARFFGA